MINLTEVVDFIRDQVCCPRRTGGCELNDADECPAQRVRRAIRAAYDEGRDDFEAENMRRPEWWAHSVRLFAEARNRQDAANVVARQGDPRTAARMMDEAEQLGQRAAEARRKSEEARDES